MGPLMIRSENNFDDDQQTDLSALVRNPFIMINEYLQDQRNRAVTTIMEPSGEALQAAKKSVGQHLISGFVRRKNGDGWHVENTWESVEISHLEEIRLAGDDEWHPLNYMGGQNVVKNAMVGDVNVVLFRNIFDWSRPDGDVWSQQIAWSGNFENCQRILQRLEEKNNSGDPLKLIRESFHLHPELRKQYITRHGCHPLVATIAAVESSKSVCISDYGDDGQLLCVICHEVFSIGEPATELRCNHLFHTRCIFHWFVRQLSCPMCRDDMT